MIESASYKERERERERERDRERMGEYSVSELVR